MFDDLRKSYKLAVLEKLGPDAAARVTWTKSAVPTIQNVEDVIPLMPDPRPEAVRAARVYPSDRHSTDYTATGKTPSSDTPSGCSQPLRPKAKPSPRSWLPLARHQPRATKPGETGGPSSHGPWRTKHSTEYFPWTNPPYRRSSGTSPPWARPSQPSKAWLMPSLDNTDTRTTPIPRRWTPQLRKDKSHLTTRSRQTPYPQAWGNARHGGPAPPHEPNHDP